MNRSSFHTTTIIFFISLCAILCMILPSLAAAKETTLIKNIKLANTRDDLLTYFDVEHAFTEKISQAAQNAIPTTFSFYLNLYKTDGTWFDKKISDIQIKSTLKYNPLKKEYSVFRPWKNESAVITKSFDEAKALMSEIDNLPVISLKRLTKGEKYQLKIKAELDRITLPLSLHYIFFFLSIWDFETSWHVINFTY